MTKRLPKQSAQAYLKRHWNKPSVYAKAIDEYVIETGKETVETYKLILLASRQGYAVVRQSV